MKFVTYPYADVSTCHITEEDGALINADGCPHRMAKMDPFPGECDGPGVFMWVPGSDDELETDITEMKEFGFSEAFCDLMRGLYEQGISYVRIHAEGDEVEGAPTFEW